MRTDTELLDWLESTENGASFERHYEGFERYWTEKERETNGFNGNIDFFSIESQHLSNVPSLREAINLAMDMK